MRKCKDCGKKECAKRAIDNDTQLCAECYEQQQARSNLNVVDYTEEDSFESIKFNQHVANT